MVMFRLWLADRPYDLDLGWARPLHYINYSCIIIYICITSHSYTTNICIIPHSLAKQLQWLRNSPRPVPAKVYIIHLLIVRNKHPTSTVDM